MPRPRSWAGDGLHGLLHVDLGIADHDVPDDRPIRRTFVICRVPCLGLERGHLPDLTVMFIPLSCSRFQVHSLAVTSGRLAIGAQTSSSASAWAEGNAGSDPRVGFFSRRSLISWIIRAQPGAQDKRWCNNAMSAMNEFMEGVAANDRPEHHSYGSQL